MSCPSHTSLAWLPASDASIISSRSPPVVTGAAQEVERVLTEVQEMTSVLFATLGGVPGAPEEKSGVCEYICIVVDATQTEENVGSWKVVDQSSSHSTELAAIGARVSAFVRALDALASRVRAIVQQVEEAVTKAPSSDKGRIKDASAAGPAALSGPTAEVQQLLRSSLGELRASLRSEASESGLSALLDNSVASDIVRIRCASSCPCAPPAMIQAVFNRLPNPALAVPRSPGL